MLKPEDILPAPLLERLENTPQNPRYHAEGNVLQHIRLVARQVDEMAEQFSLTPAEKEIMDWAAMLHDIGKTTTTVWEGERWRSPGHEKAGVPPARDILLEKMIPFEMRQQILGLVRWHGFPLRYVRYHWAESDLLSLGTITNLRTLALFSTFDFYGRISDDYEETKNLIDNFRTQAAPKAEFEMGSFESLQNAWKGWNQKFRNAAWNAIKLRQPLFIPKLVEEKPAGEPESKKWVVYLTLGAPFSGKSTWLSRNRPDAFVVQLKEFNLTEEKVADEFFIHRKANEMSKHLQIYLRNHGEVYLEGRNLHPRLREKINEVIRNMENVELRYLVFEEKLETLLERNREAGMPMSEDELSKMHSMLGILHPWEAHSMIYPENK